MTLRKCANPLCEVLVTPNVAGAHQGCCSRECERQMHKHRLVMRSSNIMSDQHRERPTPNRVHGRDNRNSS